MHSASPCFHFLELTWRRYLDLMGVHVEMQMARPGFYPVGGGIIKATVDPCASPKGLTIGERGPLRVRGFSAVAGLDESIARRQAVRATTTLRQRHKIDARITPEEWVGGKGTVLGLLVETEPVPTFFFGLGARGKPAEKVADEATDQFGAYLRAGPAAVDPHSADQIVLPLALAEGPSEYTVSEVTQHLLTNVAVIGKFIDRDIVCDGEEGRPGRVRIT